MAALACLSLLFFAQPAHATFHEMSIREVYPGGSNEASYVELQMWAGGQNLVGGHHLVAYNADGSVNDSFALTSGVANGANQSTILVADTAYSIVFDERPAPDESDANLNLSPAGGAVCWIEGSPPDCVAWGNFTGPLPAHLPELKVGAPASPTGVQPGKALRRSIARGCATLLDPPPTDDSDDSATDFSEVEPNPRDNATPPTEVECPNTTIVERPANPTRLTSASFTYEAIPSAGASFECELDGAGFSGCPAGGQSYSGLAEGAHTFKARAVIGAGIDQSPASFSWTIDTTAPTVEIQAHPEDPSSGANADFTYSSNDAKATFQCSLEPAGSPAAFTSCPAAAKSYPDAEHPGPLADGEWTFEVRATDKAGNTSTPEPFPAGSFNWEVDNTVPDTTPPETTIDSGPPNPSASANASFTYSSNEPGSTFQCRLDGSGFEACPASGISYGGLREGPHAFEVRAIDPSANVDPTPAAYEFHVALAPAMPAPPAIAPPAPSMPAAKPVHRKQRRCPHRRRRCHRRHHHGGRR